MALSFGRGKKGDDSEAVSDATPNVVPTTGASQNAATEGLDESWFEGAFDEESAAPQATPSASPPASDFDMFADLEAQPKRPTSAASFDMTEPPNAVPAAGQGDFTPFDNASSEAPVKAKGGLKKILPLLGLLLVLGGGAYFWISQQGTDVEEGEVVPPSATRPIPPQSATPPTAPKPPVAAPTGKVPVVASGDPKIKAQLKKLWNEGAAAKKAGKSAEARKKWQEAVKIGKSKPDYAQSAKLIQEALDKLK